MPGKQTTYGFALGSIRVEGGRQAFGFVRKGRGKNRGIVAGGPVKGKKREKGENGKCKVGKPSSKGGEGK